MIPPACAICTHQPQPLYCAPPSLSQLYGCPASVVASQPTKVTTPAAAAWMAVPRGAARSTPLCVGRCGVRNPEVIRPTTGTVQPEAAMSDPELHVRSTRDPVARAAPPVSVLTIWVASGSCLAYASGK